MHGSSKSSVRACVLNVLPCRERQYRTVDTQCNPEILEDPWCVPVDEAGMRYGLATEREECYVVKLLEETDALIRLL